MEVSMLRIGKNPNENEQADKQDTTGYSAPRSFVPTQAVADAQTKPSTEAGASGDGLVCASATACVGTKLRGALYPVVSCLSACSFSFGFFPILSILTSISYW